MAERAESMKHSGGRHRSTGAGSDPKAIARRIEHTRNEISATMAAIADRLSPERLANEAMTAMTDAAEQASKDAEAAASEAVDEASAAVRKLAE